MTVHVFLSSTYEDLRRERDALQRLINGFRGTKFVGMENFGARDARPLDASLQEVDLCQLYIGIFGARYGSGITELEYHRAREKGLPCHIYWQLDDDDSPSLEGPGKRRRRKALRKRLHKEHTVQEFTELSDLIAKVATDLHRFLEERARSAVRSGGAPHANRVRRFVEEYAGSPGSTVSFGGRMDEVARLDAWLGDPGSPPNLLLVAPAGRGKSALLVRWSSEVAARHDRAVVFFPVSVRFETNQESVIAAHLRARFGEIWGESSGGSGVPETIDETLDAYLSRPPPDGKGLLVVIDGIDEAAGWRPGPYLFPRRDHGIRVVVSARARPDDPGHSGWCRQLGWDAPGRARVFDLGPLTREGIQDVLDQTPDIPLSVKPRLGDELERLSGGDPLLVQLYVGEIRQGATPASLSRRAQGLDAFLRDWWQDQIRLWQQQGRTTPFESTAAVVLGLLGCSLGPLRRDDILQLTANEAVTSASLEAVLTGLSRLVIGDGEQQPYTFAHPELARYQSEVRLTDAEREAFAARFLAWGRDTLRRLASGELPPGRVSPHLVSYYGAYLELWSAEELPALLTVGWQKAWYAREGEAYSGYLADVARVQKGARELIGVEVRGALYRSSVRGRRARMPVKLFALCLKYGVLTGGQALKSVRMRESRAETADGLAQLIPHLEGAEKREAFEEAFEIARATRSGSLLLSLAPFPDEVLAEAFEVARKLRRYELAGFLRTVIPLLPPALHRQAIELIDRLDGLDRVLALSLLVDRINAKDRPRLLRRMERAVDAMPPDGDRILALCRLARHRPAAVEEALTLAEEILPEEKYFFSSGHILATLAAELDPERDGERAWRLYQAAEKNIENAVIAIVGFSARFPRAADEIRRLAILHGPPTKDSPKRQWWLRHPTWEAILVFHLPEAEREDLAARCLPVLVRASVSEDRWLNDWSRATALRLLSKLPERWAVACIEQVRQLAGDAGRALVLEQLLPAIPEAGRRSILDEELDRARMSDATAQLTALAELVRRTPETRRGELAEIIRIAAERLPNGPERNHVLARIAPWLPDDVAEDCVRAAFDEVKDIEHDFTRSDSLAELVPCLPADLRPAAIEQAIGLLSKSDFAATNALFGHMPVEQRESIFDSMVEQADFLMAEMRWSLARMFGSVIGLLSDAQLGRLLRLAMSASETNRAEIIALVATAGRLPAEQVPEYLDAARNFDSAAAKAQGLTGLLPCVANGARTAVFDEAHEACLSITDAPGGRARGLARLLDAATGTADRQIAAQAFEAAEAVTEARPRAETFKALVNTHRLAERDRRSAFERMLAAAADSARVDEPGSSNTPDRAFLLRCVADSADALAGLGGETAAEESFNAIRDAAAMWP